MNLDEAQNRKPLNKLIAPDAESGADTEMEPAAASAGGNDPTASGDGPPQATPGQSPSAQSLVDSLQALETRIAAMEQQASAYRRMLDQMGESTQMLHQRADQDSFLRGMREVFQKDPVSAVAMMINRSQTELWQAVERRVGDALAQERDAKKGMSAFLDDPQSAPFRPFQAEAEFLMREKGMTPEQVLRFFRSMEAKRDGTSKLRSAAAQKVRNESAVETGGDSNEPLDADNEFDKVIKKAKTLDEMFEALSTLKL